MIAGYLNCQLQCVQQGTTPTVSQASDNIIVYILYISSLVPRPLPEFISQLWRKIWAARKIGEWPGDEDNVLVHVRPPSVVACLLPWWQVILQNSLHCTTIRRPAFTRLHFIRLQNWSFLFLLTNCLTWASHHMFGVSRSTASWLIQRGIVTCLVRVGQLLI